MLATMPTKDLALDIFERGEAAFPDPKIHPEFRHARTGLFTAKEAQQLDDIAMLVAQYLEIPDPPRPLSIAVFGAPGSGKSRLVKQLHGLLDPGSRSKLAKLAEINLTQTSSVDDLAATLAQARTDASPLVPLVFFDEFDAKHAGAPWGWLSWFLAPMQDGLFRGAGATVTMKRAVLVFAGGTASSFDGFIHAHRETFAIAKGPDFVSRLRGYVDIQGVNGEEPARGYRRAATLRHQLLDKGKVVDSTLYEALLHVGRYKHGARSMEALIELMPRKPHPLTIEDIRDRGLLGMHVDRGALDPELIGGCVGLSGGTATGAAAPFVDAWDLVSTTLLREGATLAYGGRAAADGLTARLETTVKWLPKRLERDASERIVTSPEPGTRSTGTGVTRLDRPTVAKSEVPANLGADDHKRWKESLEHFRMRYQLALRSVGQFAIGGRLDLHVDARTKRFPGVVEELMLALALGHPVYVAGGYPGGAQWAGTLLGLGRTWSGPLPGIVVNAIKIPDHYQTLFRPPPLNDLPLDAIALAAFFSRRALGGPDWVNNGLTPEENRVLFETRDANVIAMLVRKGLLARFGTPR
jgi:hypothetical protein